MGITFIQSYYALPYHSLNGELYRISEADDFVEFLPLGRDREPSPLKGPWEVVTGESYEIFLTTHDGLWSGGQVVSAIRAAQPYTGPIAELTATADFRKPDVRHGFFIELQDDLGPEASSAPEIVKRHLCAANFNYAKDLEGNRMETSFVQTKVPVVTWDKGLVAWLEERVDVEL
ncbi:hypothetical protein BS17DRAFT_817885 [Gyrodon lividus]|nr:hypothetical protein BS17DRAFT_817885 [Gyrodon lividus]